MDKSIADRLQKIRKQNGYSQEELADMLNVSRQAVSKWECGESSPDTENLISLSKIYNTTIDELISDNSTISKTDKPADKEINSAQSAASSTLDDDEDDNLSAKQKLILSIIGGSSAIVATIIYFILGFCFNLWHPAWIVFMLIPVVSSFADAIVKKKLKHFAYPVLVATIYFLVGFITNLWHPLWVLFLTIPLYYIVLDSIEAYKAQKRSDKV